MERAWRVILYCLTALLLAGFALLGYTVFARAHDHNKPGLDSWYSGLRSGKGPCCGGPSVDATTLDGPDWETKDGHYRVRIEGEWIDVPDDAVLNEPNRDGRTLVWPLRGYLGITIRCFMPGAQI
jgi:hypothetical protein